MKVKELKHWINNARQMLIGAEDILAKADRECELPTNDLEFLDKLVWNATSKMFELNDLISEIQAEQDKSNIMTRIENKLINLEKMMRAE